MLHCREQSPPRVTVPSDPDSSIFAAIACIETMYHGWRSDPCAPRPRARRAKAFTFYISVWKSQCMRCVYMGISLHVIDRMYTYTKDSPNQATQRTTQPSNPKNHTTERPRELHNQATQRITQPSDPKNHTTLCLNALAESRVRSQPLAPLSHH